MRPTIITNFTGRANIGRNALAPIETGIWEDAKTWLDEGKYWLDNGTTGDTIWY